ncbi:MAG: hypothetical protein H5T50_02935 [Nitrososphaeria archaeon]|nr:hypothetical protein [Nitrososphaeria archaeon]
MQILGEEDLVKYPFLEETKEYIAKLGLTLNDFVSNEFEKVIRRCELRLMSSRYPPELYTLDKDTDLLSFILALIIIKASQREDVFTRFAFNEANRAEHFLKTEENKRVLTYILKRLLNINILEVDDFIGNSHYEYAIHVKDYIKLSSSLKSIHWKIVNKIVYNGLVYLKRREIIRLARDKIYQEIYKRIKDAPTPVVPQNLQYLVDIVKNRPLPKRLAKNLVPTVDPPCVTQILDKIKAGKNLSHYERFFITTFLLKRGKTIDEIISLFSFSPDFNEKIARYQVEHIAGLRGGRKQYNVPDCKTLFSQSLCYKNESCDNISHPLNYKLKKVEKLWREEKTS